MSARPEACRCPSAVTFVAVALLSGAVLWGGGCSGRDEPGSATTASAAPSPNATATSADTPAANWPRYRGPSGMGVTTETGLPTTWSDTANLKWKVELPGPGSSSPIVWGDRVFVTCYSGYGVDSRNPGDIEDLKRHLVCADRATGKLVWDESVAAELPEDAYSGQLGEHGYASNTPVTDGEAVYVFFGKTGALAFDFDGEQLWQTDLGDMSASRRWGSAASPILYKDVVIVNAADEGRAIVALDKATGKEAWTAKADGLELCYSTPLIVAEPDGRDVLVVAAPYEIWGLNPDNGKLRWYAEAPLPGNVSPSVVAHEGVVYATGGFPRQGAIAVRVGGKDDVTESHVLWTSDAASYVPSPVYHEGHLYFVNHQSVATCVEAKTGEQVYRERLPVPGRGNPVYVSALLAEGKLYVPTRFSGTFVLAAKPEFEQLAVNKFASDDSMVNASLAVASGQIFLRSNRYLYCLGK